MVNRGRVFHLFHRAVAFDGGGHARAALKIVRRAPMRNGRSCRRWSRHAGALMKQRLGLPPAGSQIQPILVGADNRAVALAGAMQARGYDIRAIRPPTVPEGTARLRIALTLHADDGNPGRVVRRSGRRNGKAREALLSSPAPIPASARPCSPRR